MERFIAYEKLSKKKKRELDQKRRGSWYGLNPVTRKPDNPKAYKRSKARRRIDDPDAVLFAYRTRNASAVQDRIGRNQIGAKVLQIAHLAKKSAEKNRFFLRKESLASIDICLQLLYNYKGAFRAPCGREGDSFPAS